MDEGVVMYAGRRCGESFGTEPNLTLGSLKFYFEVSPTLTLVYLSCIFTRPLKPLICPNLTSLTSPTPPSFWWEFFQIKFLFTIGFNASKHKKFTHKQKIRAPCTFHLNICFFSFFPIWKRRENFSSWFHDPFCPLFGWRIMNVLSALLKTHLNETFSCFVDEVESSFSIPFKACTSLHIASDWISCSRHRDASHNFGWRRVICRRTVWNESETSDLLLGSPPRHSAVWFHLKCIYDVVFGLVCCFFGPVVRLVENRLNESFSKSSTLSVTWQGCDRGLNGFVEVKKIKFRQNHFEPFWWFSARKFSVNFLQENSQNKINSQSA